MKPVPQATCAEKYAWTTTRRTIPAPRLVVERLKDFKEVYTLFDEATVIEQASRCVQCGMPFCVSGCPLCSPVQNWLSLAAGGKFIEAAALSSSANNLAELCARVCPEDGLCEGMCALCERGEPVSISAIEKFIHEYAFSHGAVRAVRVPSNGLRVAVVGSSPAGLSCADELAALGYAVTVVDSQYDTCGLFFDRAPGFRIERAVVERRLEVLRRRGIVFSPDLRLGRNVALQELLADNNAVFLGLSAQKPRPAGIPGDQLDGIFAAVTFLLEVNSAADIGQLRGRIAGKRAVVLGGGNTAMDCLRTLLRLGAKSATCIYRRDQAFMPANRREARDAADEGAKFIFQANAVSLAPDSAGHVTSVDCARTQPIAPDAKGRPEPAPVPNSAFQVAADVVFVAYGFEPMRFEPGNELARLAFDDKGAVAVDENMMTSIGRVYAGGEIIRGVVLPVYEVMDGRKAAAAIHRRLSNKRD